MKKSIIQHFRVIALYALSLSVLSPLASAQKFEVTEVKQIPVSVEAYHPVFVPGDNQLLVSEEDYYGLGVINLKDNSYKFLVEGRGAGYMPAITADGTSVVCRDINEETMALSLKNVNLQTGAVSAIA